MAMQSTIISSDGITLHLRGKRKTAQSLNALNAATLFIVVVSAGYSFTLLRADTMACIFRPPQVLPNPACSRKIFAGSLAPFAGSPSSLHRRYKIYNVNWD